MFCYPERYPKVLMFLTSFHALELFNSPLNDALSLVIYRIQAYKYDLIKSIF